MVHPGCGADVLRQRRRKDTLTKQQRYDKLHRFKDKEGSQNQLLEPSESIYKKNTLARPKNKMYHGHYTPARDSQVFNKQKCSILRINAIRQDIAKSSPKPKRGAAKKLSRHHSVEVSNVTSIKNPEGFRSKSLEQEAPPQTPPCHRVCHAMEVKGDQITFGSSSVKGSDTVSTTVESSSADVTKELSRAYSPLTIRQNKDPPFAYVSADYDKFGPNHKKGYNAQSATKENKKFRNPLKCIICYPTCIWFKCKTKRKSKSLPQIISSTKENEFENSPECSIDTHLISGNKNFENKGDDTPARNNTNNEEEKHSEPQTNMNNRRNSSVKEAFRILCICSVRCSRYRCVSGGNSDSEKAKTDENGDDKSIFDITLEDIQEEECSFYMDIPLDITVFSEFNDTKKTQKYD